MIFIFYKKVIQYKNDSYFADLSQSLKECMDKMRAPLALYTKVKSLLSDIEESFSNVRKITGNVNATVSAPRIVATIDTPEAIRNSKLQAQINKAITSLRDLLADASSTQV